MASGVGYYYDPNTATYLRAPAPKASSLHLCVFLATAALLGATTFYSRYESAVETLVDQVRVAVVLSPLLLLLAVQYWAATSGSRTRGGGVSSLLLGDQPSWHGGAGWGGALQQQRDGASSSSSPWGVALARARAAARLLPVVLQGPVVPAGQPPPVSLGRRALEAAPACALLAVQLDHRRMREESLSSIGRVVSSVLWP